MLDNYWAGTIRVLEEKVAELEKKVAELEHGPVILKTNPGCSLNGNLVPPLNHPRHLDPKEWPEKHPIIC